MQFMNKMDFKAISCGDILLVSDTLELITSFSLNSDQGDFPKIIFNS